MDAYRQGFQEPPGREPQAEPSRGAAGVSLEGGGRGPQADRDVVLLVEDEPLTRMALRGTLEEAAYEVWEASTVREACDCIDENVSVVLLDYRLPDTQRFDALHRIRRHVPGLPIILLTAYSSVDHAVDAMKEGVWHYAAKPVDPERLLELVAEACRVRRARAPATDRSPSFGRIVGESRDIREARALLARAATSPASTILLTGESGTGKDLAARAIHELSSRADGPFMNITCSALPPSLLESELFGYERGAFTDAKEAKKGLLRQGHGGTVFLDEIGELKPGAQAALLRFLQDKTFRPIGATADVRADVRVVAATNVALEDAVRAGTFRADLYFRLAVVVVDLPPLREREGDVELLADHFVAELSRDLGRDVQGVSMEARMALRGHSWPGNVRELRNSVERAILMAEGRVLGVNDFESLIAMEPDPGLRRREATPREIERDLVIRALQRAGGNQTRAAKLLGISRDQLRYRVRKFGLPPARASAPPASDDDG